MMINRRMSVAVKRMSLVNRIFTSIIVTHYNRDPEMWLYRHGNTDQRGILLYNLINTLEYLRIYSKLPMLAIKSYIVRSKINSLNSPPVGI